jgi:uncharacterized membrane-anchored protein
MFSPLGRLVLIVIGLALGGSQVVAGQARGWFVIAAAALLVLGHFRHGTVWLAFRAYRGGDVEGMERRLRQVRDPARLRKQDRAYYEFLAGVAAQGRGDLGGARAHLTAAATGRLRTDNMRSIVQCHLAEVALASGDSDGAREHLDAARRLSHAPAVDRVIGDLEGRLPAAG